MTAWIAGSGTAVTVRLPATESKIPARSASMKSTLANAPEVVPSKSKS
jgi:hypothetical protein